MSKKKKHSLSSNLELTKKTAQCKENELCFSGALYSLTGTKLKKKYIEWGLPACLFQLNGMENYTKLNKETPLTFSIAWKWKCLSKHLHGGSGAWCP